MAGVREVMSDFSGWGSPDSTPEHVVSVPRVRVEWWGSDWVCRLGALGALCEINCLKALVSVPLAEDVFSFVGIFLKASFAMVDLAL